ncbi:hypothetical protein C8J57DRAFT_1088347 [Mycena rebaudengoi]|nr:hypothetical protein C8J57DRAFT_1088347 [Mycena rebaudengoi]
MDLRCILNSPEPPEVDLVDISKEVTLLANFLRSGKTVLASLTIKTALAGLVPVSAPAGQTSTTPPRSPSPIPPIQHPLAVAIEYNVPITKKTTVSELYIYPLNTSVEYPESSASGVGHLFPINPLATCPNPTLSFTYSKGVPRGYSKPGEEVCVLRLTDANDEPVPCVVKHSTCTVSLPHTMASRQLLQTRLLNDRESRMEGTSPSRDVFRKTAALFSALKRMGCSAPLQEETTFESDEEDAQNNLSLYRSQNRRGYEPAAPSCDGRLQFNYDYKQSPFICCEHYSKNTNKDHYINTAIANGSYDIQYLEALFINDEEEIYEIEESAVELGYGPLIECSTVCNFSTQRSICPFDHRDEDGDLLQLQMIHLKCKVVFKIYEPLEEYRMQCPYVLVVVKGVHKHPIPLPVKTPPAVKTEIGELLSQFQEDLPDLTPRRFLRHPLVKAHLARKFPGLPNPMMSDVHISLSNRAHLKCFIDDIRKATFPNGTGWKVELLQSQHLVERPLTEQYIRTMVDIDASGFDVHDEDEVEQSQGLSRLKFIVLMGREGSERLLNTQYVQSDIGFKRIVGLYEFELAGWDRDAATSVVFCRIFLNRQTAIAHSRIFEALETIVLTDTGRAVQWHHLHGAEPYGDYGRKILQWAGDQHGGQAKGLGLHLQNVAQRLPDVFDLYQQTRLLKDLSPYDHLNRVFRLCVTHAFRNIRKCKVPDGVKALMRSLICIEHVDWDGTIHKIKNLGGKPAEDWIFDKEHSKFAFAGMCWAKSFIPRDIWLSGERTSNLIESVHADVNCEGLHCTMVGGVLKGEFFDSLQMKTLKAFEETGIRSSYKTGHPVENTVKNLKRKFNVYHKTLCADDQRIEDANSKIHGAHQKIHKAKERIVTAQSALGNPAAYASTYDRRVSTLERAWQSLEKARAAYTKEVGAAKELVAVGMGSRLVPLVYSLANMI